jgi:flagellar basal-body rod modification protein FlgD
MSSVYSTLTQLQSNTNKLNYERGRENLGSDKLGKDAFFQLMMAQLQNQDPTEPTDNAQFLQQQAMYAQTEAMQNLTDTMSLTAQIGQATSMVGKFVEVGYKSDDSSDVKYKTGKVDSMIISNGQVGLRVGDTVYNVNQVTKVFDTEPVADNSNASMTIPDQIVAANKLQNKYVKLEYTQPGTTTPMTFIGQVTDVTSDDKKVSIKIGSGDSAQIFNFAEIKVLQSSATQIASD